MRRPTDAVTVLSLYVALLIGLPSRLTFAPLGGAGSPAVVMGLACIGWWVYWQLQRPRGGGVRRQPVRTAYFVMLVAFLLSFVAATTKPYVSDEGSAAILGMIVIASVGGVLVVANDGPASRDRFETLLRRIVLAGGALAALAIAQFITGQSWVDRISIPGLSYNQALGGVATRSGLNRPAGTALHPIELGVVLTMILPLAFNLALVDRARGPVRRWAPVPLIMFAAFLCISRSALIGVALGTIVIAARWPRRVRRTTLCAAPFFLVLLFVTVPGLLGSLLGLFTGIGGDSSAISRTSSYGLAFEFVKRSPIVGRGFSTFLPSYRILDNEYLLLLIEVGAVGLLCTLALFVTAMVCAGRVRAAKIDPRSEQISQALKASVIVGAGCMALFDGFGFPMASGMLFLMTGLCGAAWRLAREERATVSLDPPHHLAALRRRWYVVGAGLAATATLALHVHTQPGTYWAQTDLVFLQPQSARYPNSIEETSNSVIATAGLVAATIEGADARPTTASSGTTLAGEGIKQGYAIRLPDSGGQWAHNFARPILDIQIIDPDRARVTRTQDQLIARVTDVLSQLQAADGVPRHDRITVSPAPGSVQIYHLRGQPLRATAAASAVGLICTVVGTVLLDELLLRRRRRRRRRSLSAPPAPLPA